MDLISQTEGVRHNNTRCAAIVRKHPIIHARHINTEKVFQPRTITTTDNGSRHIMPSIGNTLFHSLYSQFRRIQPKINKGWFIPSKEEWSAFGEELGITKNNYNAKGLSSSYWSSSQYTTTANYAWYAYFSRGYMDYDLNRDINSYGYVRLATTF